MMEFIDIDQFFPYLQPDLMDCPEPVMINHLRGAAIELCESAPVWQYHAQPLMIIPGVREYTLDRPSKESLVHTVLGAWYNNYPMEAYTPAETRNQWHSRFTSTGTSSCAYNVAERGHITLYGTPGLATDDTISFHVTLKPSRIAEQLPVQLYNDYHDCLVDGALARAMLMVKRPWSDPNMAKIRGKKFFDQMIEARMDAERGNVTGPKRLQHRSFTGSRPAYRGY